MLSAALCIRGLRRLRPTRRSYSTSTTPAAYYAVDTAASLLFGKDPPRGFESFYKKGESSSEGNSKDKDGGSGGDGGGKQPDKDGDGGGEMSVLPGLAALGAIGLYAYMASGPTPPEISMQELLKDFLSHGYVERLQVVNKETCRVYLRWDATIPQQLQNRLNNSANSSGFFRSGNSGGVEGQTNGGGSGSGGGGDGSGTGGDGGNGCPRELVVQLGSPESFESKLEAFQAGLGLRPQDFIPVQYTTERNYLDDLTTFAPFIIIGLGLLRASRAMSKGLKNISKAGGTRSPFNMGKMNGASSAKSDVRFSDVAGMKAPKLEVTEFVDFLKNPTRYTKMGAKMPKGALLVGPPGTGKTLLAKAVAGEASCPFFSVSGSDFVEMFVGVGPSRVRDLFSKAREKAPSIIFIDEIDAVGRKRGRNSSNGNQEAENTLNQLLVEMDGFTSSTGVIVLAGTNRADILDPALTRAGRFDRTVQIDNPDLREREEIFKVHLKPVKVQEDIDQTELCRRMAALTPGCSGSSISQICNEAAIQAARRNSTDGVEMVDFEKATERSLGGLEKQNNMMSKQTRLTVARHEAGHAIVGWFLEHADPTLKVSIIPRASGALGFAQLLPAADTMNLYTKEMLLDRMCVTLGGRAAEELFMKSITTGASDDLQKVTNMSYGMVKVYGLSDEVGLVNYHSDEPQYQKPYSEKTAELIDETARKIVSQQYERAKTLLKEKEALLHALTDKLFEKETVVYKDLLDVLGPRPFPLDPKVEEFVTATSIPKKKKKKVKKVKVTTAKRKEESEEEGSDGGSATSDPGGGEKEKPATVH